MQLEQLSGTSSLLRSSWIGGPELALWAQRSYEALLDVVVRFTDRAPDVGFKVWGFWCRLGARAVGIPSTRQEKISKASAV